MCYVQVDHWECGRCFKFLDQSERITSWILCDVGPTFEPECPNFYAEPVYHWDYLCKDCRQITGEHDRRLTTAEGE